MRTTATSPGWRRCWPACRSSAPGGTVNRLCGSSLDAIAIASRAVRSGDADLVLAGGVESMSRAPFVIPKATSAFSRSTEIHDTTIGWRFVNPVMREQFGTDSMPETAENVAAEFGIAREDQDAFALRSQERTAKAIASGRLAREIAAGVRSRSGGASRCVVDTDEHPRETSLEALAKLRPINPGGTVTAGHRLRRQRRRGRGADRLRDGGAAVRADPAGPGHLGRGGRGAAPDHGHRPGAGHAEAVVTATG